MTDNLQKIQVEKIKNRYTHKEVQTTKFDELKQLDKQVKTPAIADAYTRGTIGTLMLGTGMSLAMKVIGETTGWLIGGVVIGVVGMAIMATTHLVFNAIMKKRKAKFADTIIAKSNELLQN